LKKIGIQFALDDFGSGLSSFEYLNRFDIDHVKIDGQFIKDIDTNEQNYIVVKAIHDLSKNLNKKTIAEFVHKKEIADKLNLIGIDYLQGYWVERPIPLINDIKL
ncbi:MAG: EAL domain-containing protein, partial [Pseudomonadota bacterium]